MCARGALTAAGGLAGAGDRRCRLRARRGRAAGRGHPPVRRCAARARCGSVVVPLDRRGEHPAADPRTLQIEFELYPHRQRGPTVARHDRDAEGGPGYSTTDSRTYYLELNQPLMDRRDLLLVDPRGTGLSGPLDCPAFARDRRGLHRARRRLRRAARQPGRLLRHPRGGRRPRRRARRARIDGSTCTATATAPTSRRRSPSGTATRLRSSSSTPRIRCRAPTRRSATSPRRPGARCGSSAPRRPSCAARGEDPVAALQRLVERSARIR